MAVDHAHLLLERTNQEPAVPFRAFWRSQLKATQGAEPLQTNSRAGFDRLPIDLPTADRPVAAHA